MEPTERAIGLTGPGNSKGFNMRKSNGRKKRTWIELAIVAAPAIAAVAKLVILAIEAFNGKH